MSQPAPPAPLRLVVGLGNPGREYEQTRHNIGFMIVDRLAASAGATFRVERVWKSALARSGALLLCKPATYMNLSGDAVQPLCDFYKIAPAEMLVVLDDMALPLGKLRLRASGSSGGQNGLAHILARMGTQAVPRLRIGIGSAEPGGAVDHVLGRFAPAEQELFQESLMRGVEAIEAVQRLGLPAAMNTFN